MKALKVISKMIYKEKTMDAFGDIAVTNTNLNLLVKVCVKSESK